MTFLGIKIMDGGKGREVSRQDEGEGRNCPECGCVLDRPHALVCSRCLAEIPWASGCSGCGRCRRKADRT